jgi:hypothetical protein
MESDFSSLRYINALSNAGLLPAFRTWIFISQFDVVGRGVNIASVMYIEPRGPFDVSWYQLFRYPSYESMLSSHLIELSSSFNGVDSAVFEERPKRY